MVTGGFPLVVELRGLEPLTPTLPVWCATSCAIAPHALCSGAPDTVLRTRDRLQRSRAKLQMGRALRWSPQGRGAVRRPWHSDSCSRLVQAMEKQPRAGVTGYMEMWCPGIDRIRQCAVQPESGRNAKDPGRHFGRPGSFPGFFLVVELRGLEPLTPTLPVWCATSCAIAPHASRQ